MYLPYGLIVVVDPDGGASTISFGGVREDATVPLDTNKPIAQASVTRDAEVASRLRAGLVTVTFATSWDNAKALSQLAKRFFMPLSVVSTSPIPGVPTIHPQQVQGVLDDTRFIDELDVIGDVHGQLELLERLLNRLGHTSLGTDTYVGNGRLVVFTGDVINKGPNSIEVLNVVRQAVTRGQALLIKGNNEHWLEKRLGEISLHATDPDAWETALRDLASKVPSRRKAILLSLAASEERHENFKSLLAFLHQLPMYARFSNGDLWAVHASVPQGALNLDTIPDGSLRKWAIQFMYGPIGPRGARPDWVKRYRGTPHVVRGHVTVPEPCVRNKVISLDTGAGDGDKEGSSLSALRWPEMDFETVQKTISKKMVVNV